MGLITHISTTVLISILTVIFNKLLRIDIQAPLSNTAWMSFFFALVVYIGLGNLYYKNLSIREKIISTAVIMILNVAMGILISSASYDFAFITKLIYVSFNNAFAPLTVGNRLLNFSYLTLIPLLLLINLKALKNIIIK